METPQQAADLERIYVAADAAAMAQNDLAAAVSIARRHRVTWQDIADQLGCSRQAAWERYRHVTGEPDLR